jgi:methylphosphotriester-DNA--protein-cysteine methyltransferase
VVASGAAFAFDNYASEKAFIRAFRRWSGMAPKQYARHLRDPYDMARHEPGSAAG